MLIMPLGFGHCPSTLLASISTHFSFSSWFASVLVAAAIPHKASWQQHVNVDVDLRRDNNPLAINWFPAPPPDQGPPGAKNALRDPVHLPAQIGGIVGSYAFALVVVVIVLLTLSKRRRERLRAAHDINPWEHSHFSYGVPEPLFAHRSEQDLQLPVQAPQTPHHSFQKLPKLHTQNQHAHGHVRNFSLPSPTTPRISGSFSAGARDQQRPDFVIPSPDGSFRGRPGLDPNVDLSVVIQDRAMAQAQLEDMYKYVMEQEAAKEAGVEFMPPVFHSPPPEQQQGTSKKGRNKPASLNLGGDGRSEKSQSRTSSILSALKSPLMGKKKDKPRAISISSPIMTPMTGTFPPRHAGEEMNPISPRHYAPAAPPPLPTGSGTLSQRRNVHGAPLTPPDDAPADGTQSIDERLRAMAGRGEEDGDEDEEERRRRENYDQYRARHASSATVEADPVSAVSETSLTPLVTNIRDSAASRTSGLPSSPKPGVTRFPSLNQPPPPASPRPGATTSSHPRPGNNNNNGGGGVGASAVRPGGTLPLRAYEAAAPISPGTYDRTVKQTVFEQRAGPLSPGFFAGGLARTPGTAGLAVPYSPYQPFSPVFPVTPSLVTRADRKRMKRMEPRTPTVEMVQSSDEMW